MGNGYEKYSQYITRTYFKPKEDVVDFTTITSPEQINWQDSITKTQQPTRMYPMPEQIDWNLAIKGLPQDMTLKQKALYGVYTVLETGEMLHGSAVKWLQSSKVAPLRHLGSLYDKWGVLGMYFFVNTLWDGALAGLLSETNRVTAKTEKEYRAQGLYPVQIGQRTEYETKEDIIKSYLPIRTGKMTWEEFLQQLETRQEKNQFMQEEPMGYWNSIGNSIANADHAVTVLLKAGVDPKAAWTVGMAINIFADPFTYVSLPTTIGQFYKAGSKVLKGGFLRNVVLKQTRENLIDVTRAAGTKWSLKNVMYKNKAGDWVSRLDGEIIAPEKIKALSKHIGTDLKGWTIDQMITYGQKQAFLGRINLDELTKDAPPGIEKVLVKIIEGNPDLIKSLSRRHIVDLADPKVLQKILDDPQTSQFFTQGLLDSSPKTFNKILNLYPETYQKWVRDTGKSTALTMFEPGVMDGLRSSFDAKYVNAGIKVGVKTLVSYQDMYKVAKKWGLVDLYKKYKEFPAVKTLREAFIPGAKLKPGTHESIRLLRKNAAFLEKNLTQPVNYLLAQTIGKKYIPLIPYAIERFPSQIAQDAAKKAKKGKISKVLQQILDIQAKKVPLTVLLDRLAGTTTPIDEIPKIKKAILTETPLGKYLMNPQMGKMEAEPAIKYIQELMDEKHIFRNIVDSMETSLATTRALGNLHGVKMGKIDGYMSHIIKSSPKYAKGAVLGPRISWFQKGREAFDTIYDWKVAKLAGTTGVEFLEDPHDIFNIYTSAVSTAINKRVFAETIFEDWGKTASYIKKQYGNLEGWRFEENPLNITSKIAKSAEGKWGAYFPSDVADVIAHERDWMYLGDVMTKVAANYNKVKGQWSGLVTYRWLSFSERNYFSSMVNSVSLLGMRVLKPRSFKHANALASMDLPLGIETLTIPGVKSPFFNFKEAATKYINTTYIKTDFGQKVSLKTVQTIGELFGVPGYGWTGRTTQRLLKMGMNPATAWKNLEKQNPLQAAWGVARIGWDLWGDAGSTLSKFVEDSVRWQCFVESWKKWGDPLKAAILTKIFHFDYSELTQFERGYLTKNFAFYKFWRSNYPLQLKNYFLKRQFWSGFYRTLQATEGLSDIRFGPREATKEPPWFQYEYNMRLPFTWQDKPLYWQPDFMHMAVTRLPSAVLKFLDYGKSDTERYMGLLQPITERQYPWINYIPERLMNMDFWRQRSIKYGKEGTLAAPTHIAWAVSKIPPLRETTKLHYKRDKETGDVIPYMDAYWVHFFRQLPLVYQMGLLYNVPGRYGGYFEEQQPLDRAALFTGIKLRTIDPEYAQKQWYWESQRHLEEWRKREESRQSTRYNPEIYVENMNANQLYGWDTDEWQNLFTEDTLSKGDKRPSDIDWVEVLKAIGE